MQVVAETSLSRVFCYQQRQRQIKAASCVCQQPPLIHPTTAQPELSRAGRMTEWPYKDVLIFCFLFIYQVRKYIAFNILVNLCGPLCYFAAIFGSRFLKMQTRSFTFMRPVEDCRSLFELKSWNTKQDSHLLSLEFFQTASKKNHKHNSSVL